MNNKKKGFSLIELLAVVIILSILALITIPFIGNLIKQARINAAVVSAYGYVEAANNEVVSKQTRGENVVEIQYDIEDYNIVDGLLNIKYEGKGPETGWFNISRSKVVDGEFCINGYDIKYENGKATYVKEGKICPGTPLPTLNEVVCGDNGIDPVSGSEYPIRTADDFYCLAQKVNSGENFQGVSTKLKN